MQSNSGEGSTQQPTSQNQPQAAKSLFPQKEGVDAWSQPKDGEKPADYMKRLIAERGVTTAPPADPVQQVVETVKKEMEAPKEPEPTFTFQKPVGPEKQQEAVEPQEPQEPAEAESTDEPGSLSANYKLLRNHHKETKQNLQRVADEKAELEKKLSDYQTGVVVPEVLLEKENEIARLQTYERLFNVKGSRAYKEQVVAPLSQKNTELRQLFKDYEIPETEVDKFTSLSNRADRNRFLSEYFDSRGADQAERLLQESADVRKKAKELESGSTSAIQALEQEQARIEASKEASRREMIAANAKDSWVRALLKIRSENQIKELIPKANDPRFNERFVNPILTAASVEYGKFVTHLAESGVRELTPEMAEYAARMSLLAHASALATKTRDAALQYAQEAEEGTRIGNGYFRPQVGGGIPSSSAPSSQPAKQTFDQKVDGVLNSIIAKRR